MRGDPRVLTIATTSVLLTRLSGFLCEVKMARVEDLRTDYNRLGDLLADEVDGAKAAALARERRMLGELLESLEAPTEVSVVDQLAARRSTSPGNASRRRKSG